MDIVTPIVIFVIAVIIFTICGYCCKRKREGTVYGYGTTVTTETGPTVMAPQPSPSVVPPYPIDPRHPTPQTVGPPAPGFATHTAPYPTSALHPQPASMPYPPVPAPGVQPYGAPYPPPGVAPYPYHQAAGDPHARPPPYDVAVATPPIVAPVREAYGKQSPYNPGYKN